MKISLKVIFSFIAILSFITNLTAAEKAAKPLSPGWSFKGFFGNLADKVFSFFNPLGAMEDNQDD